MILLENSFDHSHPASRFTHTFYIPSFFLWLQMWQINHIGSPAGFLFPHRPYMYQEHHVFSQRSWHSVSAADWLFCDPWIFCWFLVSGFLVVLRHILSGLTRDMYSRIEYFIVTFLTGQRYRIRHKFVKNACCSLFLQSIVKSLHLKTQSDGNKAKRVLDTDGPCQSSFGVCKSSDLTLLCCSVFEIKPASAPMMRFWKKSFTARFVVLTGAGILCTTLKSANEQSVFWFVSRFGTAFASGWACIFLQTSMLPNLHDTDLLRFLYQTLLIWFSFLLDGSVLRIWKGIETIGTNMSSVSMCCCTATLWFEGHHICLMKMSEVELHKAWNQAVWHLPCDVKCADILEKYSRDLYTCLSFRRLWVVLCILQLAFLRSLMRSIGTPHFVPLRHTGTRGHGLVCLRTPGSAGYQIARNFRIVRGPLGMCPLLHSHAFTTGAGQ